MFGLHAARPTPEPLWLLQIMRYQNLHSRKRLLFMPSMRSMAVREDQKFFHHHRRPCHETDHTHLAAKSRWAGRWKRKHWMGAVRMWEISLLVLRQPPFQGRPAMPGVQKKCGRWTGWRICIKIRIYEDWRMCLILIRMRHEWWIPQHQCSLKNRAIP